ncbi:hypothetical protein XH92_35460 [Bradyrhizobium sp. CCBAU 53421]|nr:hypothetical protein XH92_35460 [Bradyrhizobium sp. CCBAU 53421]
MFEQLLSIPSTSRDGDDYRVNAEKSFTTNSGQADYYIVQTRSPREGPVRHLLFRDRQDRRSLRILPTHPSVSSFLYGFGLLAVR